MPFSLNKTGTLSDERRYPDCAGHVAGSETSEAAAVSMDDHRSRMHRSIIECLADGAELTGDEMAGMLGWNRYQIRPRLAELHRGGTVEDTGARRVNVASGRRAAVWRLVVADGRADEPRPTESLAA
ncbi:MAG: hypothetical protein Q7J32_17575 [Sphingomonadaceae bacterium]|nr:hypothetical protein [Sphingomonadaceae bacterium]